MQTSGKILRFTQRSLASDAVSELARSILHPACGGIKKLKRANGGIRTIQMCCTCATSCGELSSRIAPAILSAMHRSSTDKLRCSKTGAGSSDSGTGSAPMTTGGCSSGASVRGSYGAGSSSSSMRRPPSSGSSSGTGGCSGSSSTGALSGTTPALLDLKRLPAACASPAASKTDAASSGLFGRMWAQAVLSNTQFFCGTTCRVYFFRFGLLQKFSSLLSMQIQFFKVMKMLVVLISNIAFGYFANIWKFTNN